MISDKINSEIISLARKTSLSIEASCYLGALIDLPNLLFVHGIIDIC
jgi:hypothetical protein